MNHYYYLTELNEIVRIAACKKPGPNTVPKYSGAWVVQEYDSMQKSPWVLGSFPQITWKRLKNLTYIGAIK